MNTTSVVITEHYNVTVNSEKLTGTTEHLTLQARWRTNRFRYKRVPMYFGKVVFVDISVP
jgi:hypothetical protein